MLAPPAYWQGRAAASRIQPSPSQLSASPRGHSAPWGSAGLPGAQLAWRDTPDPMALEPRKSHAGDQLLDSLVHRAERVLAQHGPLGLVVQLQVNPVDGEITPLLLGPADELAAQLRPRRLRRHGLGLEDVDVAGGPL